MENYLVGFVNAVINTVIENAENTKQSRHRKIFGYMLSIKNIIQKDGSVFHTLSEPYNTGRHFTQSKWCKKSTMLNIVDVVEYYDYYKCVNEYEDGERDEDGYLVNDLENYIAKAERSYEKGLFLHLSDGDDSLLCRDAIITLSIDDKKYELTCFFAPGGHRSGYVYSTDLYCRITPEILMEMSFATSIKISYKSPSTEEAHATADITSFSEWAQIFFEQCYIKDVRSEDKTALMQEWKAKKAAKEKEEEEKARKEAEEKARKQEEWDNADTLQKLLILVKRHWKLILFISFILWIYWHYYFKK